mgnify:FL=1
MVLNAGKALKKGLKKNCAKLKIAAKSMLFNLKFR